MPVMLITIYLLRTFISLSPLSAVPSIATGVISKIEFDHVFHLLKTVQGFPLVSG